MRCAPEDPARTFENVIQKAQKVVNPCRTISAEMRIGGKQRREFGWGGRGQFGRRASRYLLFTSMHENE